MLFRSPATYTIDDTEITLLDPTKAGYDFDEWTPGDSIPGGSTGDKTFTATWTPIVYTITYNMDGGTNNAGNPATYTIEDAEITLLIPIKDGHTFTGWTPDSGVIPTGYIGGTTCRERVTPTVYTTTDNVEGNTNNAGNPSTYTIEDTEITLLDPTKAGYNFAE